MFSKLVTASAVSLVGFLVACGASDGSDFGNTGGNGTGNGTGTGNGSGTGPGNTFSVVDDDAGTGTAGGGTDPKCASAVEAAKLTPVNLIFMYDKSGSMGNGALGYACRNNGYRFDCGDVTIGGTPAYLCAYVDNNNNFTVSCSVKAGVVSCKSTATGVYTGNCIQQTLNGKAALFCEDTAQCQVAYDYDPAKKWIPVGNAMKSFFTDPKSVGMSATLGFFPKQVANKASCSITDYQTPAVPLTPLGPSATAFGASISAQTTDGNTPSLPALKGALAAAETVRVAHPGEATAVVLVTDGMPTVCDSADATKGDVGHVADAALAAAKAVNPINTYVIGVQDAAAGNLAVLDQVAAAGSKDGKGKAFIVTVGNPTQTSADLQKALEAIRGSAISCDVALPPPPAGKTLDINAVNVVTKIGGKEDTLAYSKDCATGAGWHYDNPSAPKQVKLCPASCDAVRASAGGQLSIAFGCATKGGVIL